MMYGWDVVSSCAHVEDLKCKTPSLYDLPMSSWDDHEQLIDDQYLMESIEEDQKAEEGSLEEDEEE
jgi:hypothetical protein